MTKMTTNSERVLQRGLGSEERPLARVLLARDSMPDRPVISENGNTEPDNLLVNYARYYDRDYARREHDKIWMKSWLLACREEDIPNVGDRVPFDFGPASFIIIRSAPDSFKALYNSCMHRGTQLCTKRSSGDSIRCPVHAWEWNVDGSLKKIPSWWDFTDVTRANGSLREAKLGRWGGFIFINADPDCVPLEVALGPIPRHFEGYQMEERYTAARFRKLMPANWKLALEAFQESYHLAATHPEAAPFNGDAQTQYDIWDSADSHVARIITPTAIPSMLAGPEATTLQAAIIYAHSMIDWHYPGTAMPSLDPAGDLRAQLASWHRAAQREHYGKVVDAPDAVMLDTVLYHVFPQAVIWQSESLPFIYSFTPHESDPELSYFDCRILLPCAAGKPRPPAAVPTEIGLNETVAGKAADYGPMLGNVFDQDIENMPRLQRGVKAADPRRHHSHLGAYQEMVLQHWHKLHDEHMSR